MQLKWDTGYEKGIPQMDNNHREFITLVNQLHDCEDAEFHKRLCKLVDHTREHFAQEDRWMDETGFPPIKIHVNEHKRVIHMLDGALEMAQQGELGSTRQTVERLRDWFHHHAESMDNALALHLKYSNYQPAH